MTEEEAVAWCHTHFGAERTTMLDRFREMVLVENERQNLISPASCEAIWSRHIVDSAQLVAHASTPSTAWFDIGSGPGFPGLVVAIVTDMNVTLVEPRARRVEFLHKVVAQLGLKNVSIQKTKAEASTGRADIISARAVASIADIIAMTSHLRHPATRMILPRGRNGASEVATLPARWQSLFHVEHSVTDPNSVIVVADGVRS